MRGVAWNCEIVVDDVTTGTGTGTTEDAVVGSDGATIEGFTLGVLVGCCRASLGSLGRTIVDPPVEEAFA